MKSNSVINTVVNSFVSPAKQYLIKSGIQEYLDMDVTEIVINKLGEVAVEGSEGWKYFKDDRINDSNLQSLLSAIALENGVSKISESDPIKSLVMPNGERMQAIIPPASLSEYSITIRKPSMQRFVLSDYEKSGRLGEISQIEKIDSDLLPFQKELLCLYEDKNYVEFIKKGIENRLNFLIVGGTGSGKTTFAKAMLDEFPQDRRIITIEDVHEMTLPNHKNKVHLFYKKGIVESKYLIESAMRMKPDHIILAELRGEEAWSYIEALNTGHEGSVTTIHANNCQSAFSRLNAIIKQSKVGMTLDYELIDMTVKSSIDVLLFFRKTKLQEIYFNPIEKNKILAGVK